MNFKSLESLVLTKVFVSLVFLCFVGVWFLDFIFSIYNWNLDFLDMIWVSIKSCAVVGIIFLPIDLYLSSKKKKAG